MAIFYETYGWLWYNNNKLLNYLYRVIETYINRIKNDELAEVSIANVDAQIYAPFFPLFSQNFPDFSPISIQYFPNF